MTWEQSKFDRLEKEKSAAQGNANLTLIRGAILVCFLIVLLMYFAQFYFRSDVETSFNPGVHEHYKKLTAHFEYAAGNTKLVRTSMVQPALYEKQIRQLLPKGNPSLHPEQAHIIAQATPPVDDREDEDFAFPPLESDTILREAGPGQYEFVTTKNIPTPVTLKDGVNSIQLEVHRPIIFPIASQELSLSLPINEVGAELPSISVFVRPFENAQTEDYITPSRAHMKVEYAFQPEFVQFTIRLNQVILPGEQVILNASWKANSKAGTL